MGARQEGIEQGDRIQAPWGPRTPYGPGAAVKACQPQTATQLKWRKTRMKQAAPQALVVAS